MVVDLVLCSLLNLLVLVVVFLWFPRNFLFIGSCHIQIEIDTFLLSDLNELVMARTSSVVLTSGGESSCPCCVLSSGGKLSVLRP